MENETLILSIKEKYGATDIGNIYAKPSDQNAIVRLTIEERKPHSTTAKRLNNFFRQVFLPQGYPNSVSQDYFQYQFYDTIQAFCSRITGTIATKAILHGVGVGDANATPLAAAITWIFKDGTGMFGSIMFAWWKGSEFDSECKKWRFFADILNDFAMFIEMWLPLFPNSSLLILCLTSAMKAGVGVCGSATRAAITHHQAIRGNMADVSAKDGSQETAVNLVASILALFILTLIQNEKYQWYIFIVFTALHLFSNYLAVSSLVFNTLNKSRMVIMLRNYFRYDLVNVPSKVNGAEPILHGYGINEKELCGFHINMGESLANTIDSLSYTEFNELISIHNMQKYLIVPNITKHTIDVVLLKGETATDVISAYFHANIMGIALSIRNKDFDLKYLGQTVLHTTSLSLRLQNMVSRFKRIESEDDNQWKLLRAINEFVEEELINFLYELQKSGWAMDRHAIYLNDWRLESLE